MSGTNGTANGTPLRSDHVLKVIESLEKFKRIQATQEARDQRRMDAWFNDVTGHGTDRDKTTFGFVAFPRWLDDQELSNLYHGDDMAARMVDVVPEEMLREPIDVDLGDPEASKVVDEKLASLSFQAKAMDAIRWARCYGGCALLLGADDGRPPELPLVPERAKSLSYLYVVDRRMLWPETYYSTPGHPRLGEPETYRLWIEGRGAYLGEKRVHETRLVIFPGTPTGAREKVQLSGWDMSIFQRAWEALRMFHSGWSSIENLLADGNQAVYSVSGLNEIIASGGIDLLKERVKAQDFYRSVVRAMVIDADGKEKFERHHATLTDIPATLDKVMLRLSAAVQIPVTILMGQSPAGMNATGESDFRWFYDRIRSLQNGMLTPRVRRVVEVFLRTREGRALVPKFPERISVKYLPLWKETPLAEAQRRKVIAETDGIQIQSQVHSPEKVALTRGQPDGWDQDVTLSPEETDRLQRAQAVRIRAEQVVEEELGAAGSPTEEEVEQTSKLELAPADIAAVVTVNEARAAVGLGPIGGPDGDLSIPEFKAKHSEAIAEAAAAEAGTPIAQAGVEVEEARFDATLARAFTLYRKVDETGVSGTGEVADGCRFGDGKVAIRWRTKTASTTIFDSMEDMLAVHSHGNLTVVRWKD